MLKNININKKLFEIKFLKRHCYIYVYLYIIYNKVKSNRKKNQ